MVPRKRRASSSQQSSQRARQIVDLLRKVGEKHGRARYRKLGEAIMRDADVDGIVNLAAYRFGMLVGKLAEPR
jgi:hypothetical protein